MLRANCKKLCIWGIFLDKLATYTDIRRWACIIALSNSSDAHGSGPELIGFVEECIARIRVRSKKDRPKAKLLSKI